MSGRDENETVDSEIKDMCGCKNILCYIEKDFEQKGSDETTKLKDSKLAFLPILTYYYEASSVTTSSIQSYCNTSLRPNFGFEQTGKDVKVYFQRWFGDV